jgi:hypothetical protein
VPGIGPDVERLWNISDSTWFTQRIRELASLQSLRGLEFEQRVAPCFGEVILGGVVNAYPVSA